MMQGRPSWCVASWYIFDAIDEVHKSIGHKKINSTMEAVKLDIWNKIRDQVEEYVKLGLVCNQQQPNVSRMVGAMKPITSLSFRDRFQVDLVDMRCRRMKNIYRIVMRWIVTLKYHCTRIAWHACIPQKHVF